MRPTPALPLLAVALLLVSGPAFAQSAEEWASSASPAASLHVMPGFVVVTVGETGRIVARIDGPSFASYAFALRGADGVVLERGDVRVWADERGDAEATLFVRAERALDHPLRHATLVATDETGAVVEASLDVIVLPRPTPIVLPPPRPEMPEIVLSPPPPIFFERPGDAIPRPVEAAPPAPRPFHRPFFHLFGLFRVHTAQPMPMPMPAISPTVLPMPEPPTPFEFRTIDLGMPRELEASGPNEACRSP